MGCFAKLGNRTAILLHYCAMHEFATLPASAFNVDHGRFSAAERSGYFRRYGQSAGVSRSHIVA